MAIHPREKREFYHGLARLVESGANIPSALETLRTGASSAQRKLIRRLLKSLKNGDPVPQAFQAAHPLASELESSVMGAGSQAGRIVQCARYLSGYFDSLATLRATLWKRSAYSIFVFHLGVVLLGLPTAMLRAGWSAYFTQVLATLGITYAIAGTLSIVIGWIQQETASSTSIDEFVRAIPIVGSIRKALTVSRFCATYEMQLEAGVNVFEALSSAAHASQSALYIRAARKMRAALSSGLKPGELMEKYRVFPRDMVRRIRLGEETGHLDDELRRLADEYQQKALGSVETLGEWAPRLLYFGVVLYSGWQIIQVYSGMTAGYTKMLDQM